jgi:aldose 1-epimerase
MITAETFGRVDGQSVRAFTLQNAHGLRAKVLTYGARLAELWVPDRSGTLANIVLGHDRVEDYVSGTSYFGATCGRYANRIRDGRFSLDGVVHQLDLNEGSNALHGGPQGFDQKLWEVEKAEGCSVTFRTTSADGEMGYPGHCILRCTYTLTEDDQLTVVMEAETDAPTVINIVNHAYFNLAGAGSGDCLGQLLRVDADHYTPVGPGLLPTGEPAPVAGTPFDFRALRPIGGGMEAVAAGYDHNWCLNGSGMRQVVEAVDPKSGRRMVLVTNEPGVQLYVGGYIPDGLAGSGGKTYGRFEGFTLETQKYPDSPNQPQFPSARLNPGQEYRHEMVFSFSVD